MKSKVIFPVLIVLLMLIACQPSTVVDKNTQTPKPSQQPPAEVIPTETQEDVSQSSVVEVVEATADPNAEIPSSPAAEPITITEIADDKGVPMMFVPEGTFYMGSENHQDSSNPDFLHTVHLGAFYIDKFEVTNALYNACVRAGRCEPPKQKYAYLPNVDYYGNPEFDNYPVIWVDWYKAKAYCEQRDARLPTEAEWEESARGTDLRTYPWGEREIKNISSRDPFAVGSSGDDISPFGVYDMAGNVSEWTSSLYQSYPYDPDDGREDLNIEGNRVIKGGRVGYDYFFPISFRDLGGRPQITASWEFGFRCAKDVPVGTPLVSITATATAIPTATSLPSATVAPDLLFGVSFKDKIINPPDWNLAMENTGTITWGDSATALYKLASEVEKNNLTLEEQFQTFPDSEYYIVPGMPASLFTLKGEMDRIEITFNVYTYRGKYPWVIFKVDRKN